MIFNKHGLYFSLCILRSKVQTKSAASILAISPSRNRDQDAGNYNQYYFAEPFIIYFHIMLSTVFKYWTWEVNSNYSQAVERIKSNHHYRKSCWIFRNYLNKRRQPILISLSRGHQCLNAFDCRRDDLRSCQNFCSRSPLRYIWVH